VAVRDSQPLRALGEQSVDPAGTAMTMEFVALGNHREAICADTGDPHWDDCPVTR
jgi:TetR/AcrR family transcriptional regulator